jgi:hypothetical protein
MQLAEDGDRQASKLAALWHDIWLEAYSWLRYFFVYLLPRGLSYPFQFAIWNGFYTLLLVAVLAGNVGTGPVRDFLQALRFDLWSKLFGQNSGTALGALLTSLPGWFVFGGGILLVVWGAVVFFWARHQRRFFKSLRDAGIQIVRGPGRRMSFLNRLHRFVSTLGLGPTARILPTYVPRHEDPLLRHQVKDYQKNRPNLGLLITSIATAGKTRTAMELIADANPVLVFVWPREVRAGGITSSDWNGSAILFADDVALPVVEGGVALPSAMLPLLQGSPKIVMIGTIRRNLLPEDRRSLEVVELSEMEPGRLRQLAEVVAVAEKKMQGSKATADGVMRRYNGHPGGLVAGLDAMRTIYQQLNDDQRAALRGVKLLRALGIQDLSTERVREAAEVITARHYDPTAFHDILDRLTKAGLISWAGRG